MPALKFGYARVSRNTQETFRQIDILNNYGVDEIFTEKITGTKANRPELLKLKNKLRAGDVVVIESLSRLGRSTKDLLNLIEEWNMQDIKLISLKENIDTTTPTGKLLITVLSAISQFERDIIVQRTNEGLQAEKAVKLYHAQVHSIKEITAITGISQATLYRALKNNNWVHTPSNFY